MVKCESNSNSKQQINKSKTFTRALNIDTVNKTLQLHQYFEGSVNCVVWDAAIVLAKYLEELYKNDRTTFNKKNILELGSGLGCVGLTAACLGANVTLTDLPEAVPLTELNLKENLEICTSDNNTVQVVSLIWGEDVFTNIIPDVILLADCIYYKESVEPLTRTLVKLANLNTKILLAQEMRDSTEQRNNWQNFLQCIKKDFFIQPIPLSEQHEDFRSPDILLFQISKTE